MLDGGAEVEVEQTVCCCCDGARYPLSVSVRSLLKSDIPLPGAASDLQLLTGSVWPTYHICHK